jgi:hypothetical protein
MNALVPYEQVQSMATAMAKSGLFGMKTPDQALALMLVAQAEGQHPATIAQDYDIIQGRAARKTHSVMARFQAAGGKVEWHELTDTKADATFSHAQGGSLRMTWTMEQAKRIGLTGKDNWKNYPRAMLRARCIAEGVRAVYPAAIGGLLVAEEASDMPPPPPARQMGAVEVVPQAIPDALMEAAQDAADKGVEQYAGWWKSITKDQRRMLAKEHAALKLRAEQADKSRTVEAPAAEADPFVAALGDD